MERAILKMQELMHHLQQVKKKLKKQKLYRKTLWIGLFQFQMINRKSRKLH
ncbi:hypothetical protein [Wolbachia endosymbiont (group A) of Sphecodes monilicornis]|uniref:hypothetical protein n=1 Tax=Wolbachia endosymbiont (group A) of Sphecodes monilicornis TaxID=2954060 RepID=UPI0022274398|nr:hypothetical protein [Wolbachia endosymbiont (group A) of Sphecodes monilicornis]